MSNGAGAHRTRPTGIGPLDDLLREAAGHGHRQDPILSRTGGPAGNPRLTSWTGLVLLVLIVAELVTLLDVTGLIDWHVGVGIALTGLAMLKTASTGWRIVRYYAGVKEYRSTGPPPTPLRILGPFVIGSTMGVLGSGIALVAIGPTASRQPWFSLIGQEVSPLTIHQGFFILFAVLTGLHLLARFVPAVSIVTGRPAAPNQTRRPVPAAGGRAVVLIASLLGSAVAVSFVLRGLHGWQGGRLQHLRGHRPG